MTADHFRVSCGPRVGRTAAIVVALAIISVPVPGPGWPNTVTAAGHSEDDGRSAIVHVLNRTTFGPRPGDVDRVSELGIAAFIERQLHPDQIDDGPLKRELARLETVDLDTATIVERYHLPSLMARRARRRAAARSGSADAESGDTPQGAESRTEPDEMRRRRQNLPPEIERGQIPLVEHMTQKLARAVSSERQLQEVLVDFWFNHFNVSARKSPLIQPFVIEYERDVIRPRVFGRFRDLLGAVAESPAMLIYLDNWLSSDPDAPAQRTDRSRRGQRRGRFGFVEPGRRFRAQTPDLQRGRRDGLNENYARELLELHTLGVDGGYTQADVINVAQAFSGWTLAPLWQGGGFRFSQTLHVDGPTVVLGDQIDAGGKADGDLVLDLLASHPSTARSISTKLARHFVTDDPPDSLVARAAKRFLDTDGDLRAVTRSILTSPEFLSETTVGAKVKTPLEFVVSGIRALDGTVTHGGLLSRVLGDLGMPLYLCQPPTGYSDQADSWVNAGALLGRMNVAIALAGERIRGVSIGLPIRGGPSRGEAIYALLDDVVISQASDATRRTIAKATTPQEVAVLALGSPKFQQQ